MPTIELVLRDDNNQIIGQQSTKKYSLNLNSQTVHDIEGAVEEFKSCALPDITLSLLEAAQTAFIHDKKRPDL
jgi:hypothetical protein